MSSDQTKRLECCSGVIDVTEDPLETIKNTSNIEMRFRGNHLALSEGRGRENRVHELQQIIGMLFKVHYYPWVCHPTHD